MKDSYKLAAVQMEIRNRKYPYALINDIRKIILFASSKKVDVIVFPDYMDLNLIPHYVKDSISHINYSVLKANGLDLNTKGLVPNVNSSVPKVNKSGSNINDSGSIINNLDSNINGLVSDVNYSVLSLTDTLKNIFKTNNFFVKELIFTELINLAKKYKIFICTGGWLEIKNNRFKKSIALISPSDGIIFEGISTHLFPWEYDLNFFQGENLLFNNDVLGSVGMLVGGEIYFPEVSRILNLLGAKILLASNIDKSLSFSINELKNKSIPNSKNSKFTSAYNYNDFKYRAGIWRDVQQNQVFACESFLVGNLGNDKLEGRASIIGPCEMTDDGSGIIAQASSCDKEEIVVGEVKISELEKIRKKYPIKKFLNPDLYKKYLPNIYEKVG